ncbi:MAG: CoA-binding protein [Candidatus Acidiferrales bacterium]
MSESDIITQILNSSKTIAVVGLSGNRMRASFHVAEYLQSVGYKIIPVNPNETAVLGEKSYARLQDVPVSIDVVQIFRRPAFVPEIVDAAIQIKARCVWMQEGIVHAEAAERARRAGILVVMNTCMLKEHVRRSRGVPR